MPVETLAEAVNRLTKAGYVADFRVEDGRLCAAGRDCRHRAEEFEVDEIVRFEGVTDPADESIVFALKCKPHGTKGTYTVPYGPRTPTADEEIMRALEVGSAKPPLSTQP